MTKEKLMCQVLVTCKSSVVHSKYVLDPDLFGRLGLVCLFGVVCLGFGFFLGGRGGWWCFFGFSLFLFWASSCLVLGLDASFPVECIRDTSSSLLVPKRNLAHVLQDTS